jgi:hypothetical protein
VIVGEGGAIKSLPAFVAAIAQRRHHDFGYGMGEDRTEARSVRPRKGAHGTETARGLTA